MPAQKYYILPGIQQLKKHLIRQDIVEYIILSHQYLLVLVITGL